MDNRTREQIRNDADYAQGFKDGKESVMVQRFFQQLLPPSEAYRAGYEEGINQKGK